MSWDIVAKKGGYKIISSITDKPVHKGIINESQVKALLVVRAFEDGVRNALRVENYPSGFILNGEMQHPAKPISFDNIEELAPRFNALVKSLNVNGMPYIEIK